MLKELRVDEFMEKLASAEPVPGGGSASALAGATAAGLTAMVASLTAGKAGYEPVWEEMENLLPVARQLQEQLLALMDADADSYRGVLDCFRMPKDCEEEKAVRSRAIQEATRKAAEVPLAIAETAGRLFDLAEVMVQQGNRNAVSDGAVAAFLARAAVQGALLNVRINAVSLKDIAVRQALEEKAAALAEAANRREKEIIEKLTF